MKDCSIRWAVVERDEFIDGQSCVFLIQSSFASRKHINKINMVTLARSGVKITACRVILFLFLPFFFFGCLPLCCSLFKWFYRAGTVGDFRVAPLLLFLNNLSALAQYYHAQDSLLWYCVCSRTIPHTPSLSKIKHTQWAQWHPHQMIN